MEHDPSMCAHPELFEDASKLKKGMWILIYLKEGWCPALVTAVSHETKMYSTWYPATDKLYCYSNSKWRYPDTGKPLKWKMMVRTTGTEKIFGGGFKIYADPSTNEALIAVSPTAFVTLVSKMPPIDDISAIVTADDHAVSPSTFVSDVEVAHAERVLKLHQLQKELQQLFRDKKRLADQLGEIDTKIHKLQRTATAPADE